MSDKELDKTKKETENDEMENEDDDLSESFSTIFDGVDLTEDFKNNVVTLVEGLVAEKENEIRQEYQESFDNALSEEVEVMAEELIEKLSSYLSMVVENWKEENKIEIESAIKVEVAESLIASLSDTLSEHNIVVDESDIEVVEESENRVAYIEDKYARAIERLSEANAINEELNRTLALKEATEGMTMVDKDRLEVMAEGISFETYDDFVEKITSLRENVFGGSTPKSPNRDMLEEVFDAETTDDKDSSGHDRMKFYAEALANSLKN